MSFTLASSATLGRALRPVPPARAVLAISRTSLALIERRHVDLQLQASALCRP